MKSYTTSADGLRHYKQKAADDKDTSGVPNGSDLYEMDTGNLYMFDVDTKSWILQ